MQEKNSRGEGVDEYTQAKWINQKTGVGSDADLGRTGGPLFGKSGAKL